MNVNEKCVSVRKYILHILREKELTWAERDRRYQERFDAQETQFHMLIQSAKEAVTKAEAASDRRFDSVNEFRASLADQTAHLIPRNEYDAAHHALEARFAALTDRLTLLEGGNKGSARTWGIVIAVAGIAISLVIGIITLLLMHMGGDKV